MRSIDDSSSTFILLHLDYVHLCVCFVCLLSSLEPLFGAFALKLILNAISTGANILKGRIYCNTMINLTVANDKVEFIT